MSGLFDCRPASPGVGSREERRGADRCLRSMPDETSDLGTTSFDGVTRLDITVASLRFVGDDAEGYQAPGLCERLTDPYRPLESFNITDVMICR